MFQSLILPAIFLKSQETGEVTGEVPITREIANGIALHRIALGFPAAMIPVTPWPQHYGYRTSEGAALNETARDYGDDPDHWFVAEQRVSLDHLCEMRLARSKQEPQDGASRRTPAENEGDARFIGGRAYVPLRASSERR